MRSHDLGQDDLERISAWLDGELDARQSAEVAARVQRDPAWSAAAEEFRRVGTLLEHWQTPPLRRDLTDAIVAKARSRRQLPTWVRLAAPLAAAAAIVLLAVTRVSVEPPTGTDGNTPVVGASDGGDSTPTSDPLMADIERIVNVPDTDRFVVENLDIVRDYDVLKDFETLQAIASLERRTEGI